MKNTILFVLLAFAAYAGQAQHTVLKTGIYHHYRSLENNKPSDEANYTLVPFTRVNKIDRNYNDTLYRLLVNGEEKRNAFAIYSGTNLYVTTEDSLYRRMDYVGRFPFVTVSNKLHFDEGFVIENKTPVWKEERDEVHTYIAFVNKQGNLVIAEFESMWAFLKGDNDLSKPFGKEKHVNETYKRYIVMMNERYPL
jgi:hypothetical protein